LDPLIFLEKETDKKEINQHLKRDGVTLVYYGHATEEETKSIT